MDDWINVCNIYSKHTGKFNIYCRIHEMTVGRYPRALRILITYPTLPQEREVPDQIVMYTLTKDQVLTY